MRVWMRRTAGALGLGVAVGALAVGAASRRWRATTEELTTRLTRGVAEPGPAVSFAMPTALPEPVERYFRAALRDGQPRVRTARARQAGWFRTRSTGDPEIGWQRFEATQVFSAGPPGFVWDARIHTGPVPTMWVRDGYVERGASMYGTVLGAMPVVDQSDGPELRAGALQRYLAEAVWLPTVLLPGSGVTWAAMDATHARATLTDGATSVSLEFEFGAGGDIVAAYAPARQRSEPGHRGGYVTLPWGGRYREHAVRGGMRVPLEAEVYWVVEGREQPYFRGRIEDIEYEFSGSP